MGVGGEGKGDELSNFVDLCPQRVSQWPCRPHAAPLHKDSKSKRPGSGPPGWITGSAPQNPDSSGDIPGFLACISHTGAHTLAWQPRDPIRLPPSQVLVGGGGPA